MEYDHFLHILTENFGGFDIFAILVLSVPIFLLYCIFTIIYFKKIDVVHVNKLKKEKRGLSRMILGGIFFMFGLIIFDLAMEFVSAFAFELAKSEDFTALIMNQSIMLQNICKTYRSIPIDQLINFTIICTAIYTGTEGAIAGLKTINMSEGIVIELPPMKRKRLSVMFYIWCYIAVIATLYTMIIGSDKINFHLENIYISLGLNLLILFIAERGPATLENVNKVASTKDAPVIIDISSHTSKPKTDEDEKCEDELFEDVVADKMCDIEIRKIILKEDL